VLGPDRAVLVMANHGVIVCGETVAEAYDHLYYFERACQVQLYAMWTGRAAEGGAAAGRGAHPAAIRGLAVYGGKPASDHHFRRAEAASLDRSEPELRD